MCFNNRTLQARQIIRKYVHGEMLVCITILDINTSMSLCATNQIIAVTFGVKPSL